MRRLWDNVATPQSVAMQCGKPCLRLLTDRKYEEPALLTSFFCVKNSADTAGLAQNRSDASEACVIDSAQPPVVDHRA
ncbi:hypothetical protein EVAR_83422_1 [Eumeta japonica]|uniref:Uncharacterized protein n=1 Tax=Eumeta variegata TaxID=151549 RepID=A0A4C1TYH6_EUMVA|nr:hypothetical protein EVAR_83422_1 [Eumeta japonica]